MAAKRPYVLKIVQSTVMYYYNSGLEYDDRINGHQLLDNVNIKSEVVCTQFKIGISLSEHCHMFINFFINHLLHSLIIDYI